MISGMNTAEKLLLEDHQAGVKVVHQVSKHPDLINQHHTQGHTFELLTNCGDRSVPLHLDDTSEDAEGGQAYRGQYLFSGTLLKDQ
ncbi:hypothetical protein AQUCO_03300030v1 [Aquilegia coerulea]|uniref:Uncharacterized protein n=1 Tax=Aquilegia coerulea TaxID=218851 RepID=A0A2G5CZ64_AQUCA|nr:hypothetical protein AQUCO_03300030v1 [Aquilegia coerulea]